MEIPDFTQFSLKYVSKDDVKVGERIFHIRIAVIGSDRSWPFYHIEDKTDDSGIGVNQRKIVGPERTKILRATTLAVREAGWSVYPDGVLEAPLSHLTSALKTIQDGGWNS